MTNGASRSVDLLFDVRHIDQSGIGTYMAAQVPVLEDVLEQHGRTLALLADRTNVPAVRDTTTVVFSVPPSAPMYSIQEQRAWDHAIRTVRPKALWLPHYPFPFTLLRPGNRRILSFATVHDDNAADMLEGGGDRNGPEMSCRRRRRRMRDPPDL